MNTRAIITIVVILSLLAACSDERQLYSPDDVGVLAVNAVMTVDKYFPTVVLYRTQPVDEEWIPEKAAERGAHVIIVSGADTAFYDDSVNHPGVYRWWWCSDPDFCRVKPEKTYRLIVTAQTGERLTATTTTPPRLSINEWVVLDDTGTTVERRLKTYEEIGDSVYRAPENQLVYPEGLLEARFDPVNAAAYQVGVNSLDPFSDFTIDPEFLDDEDMEEFERSIASGFIRSSEEAITLPWLAIFFYGRYKIRVFAVDRNWYDLVRSSPQLEDGGPGFGGNIGDGFERPIFNVSGGIGLFGSVSVDSIGFFVAPKP